MRRTLARCKKCHHAGWLSEGCRWCNGELQAMEDAFLQNKRTVLKLDHSQ